LNKSFYAGGRGFEHRASILDLDVTCIDDSLINFRLQTSNLRRSAHRTLATTEGGLIDQVIASNSKQPRAKLAASGIRLPAIHGSCHRREHSLNQILRISFL
jgi:predicted HAD superfamily phosphohydrolase YqeG